MTHDLNFWKWPLVITNISSVESRFLSMMVYCVAQMRVTLLVIFQIFELAHSDKIIIKYVNKWMQGAKSVGGGRWYFEHLFSLSIRLSRDFSSSRVYTVVVVVATFIHFWHLCQARVFILFPSLSTRKFRFISFYRCALCYVYLCVWESWCKCMYNVLV